MWTAEGWGLCTFSARAIFSVEISLYRRSRRLLWLWGPKGPPTEEGLASRAVKLLQLEKCIMLDVIRRTESGT